LKNNKNSVKKGSKSIVIYYDTYGIIKYFVFKIAVLFNILSLKFAIRMI